MITKKIIISIFVMAGIGGLLAIISYKPPTASLTALTQQTPSSSGPKTEAASTSIPSPTAPSTTTSYKNGTFTGDTLDVGFGPVQIAVTIQGGQITNVNFLQMPSDRAYSRQLTAYSEPLLKQETIKAQSASVDIVSGASQTSQGFIQSLQSALSQAS